MFKMVEMCECLSNSLCTFTSTPFGLSRVEYVWDGPHFVES
jgi:hypothetical protein